MAYWTECQHCGQWSVSSTRLVNVMDKRCPHCGNQLQEENESEYQVDIKAEEE